MLLLYIALAICVGIQPSLQTYQNLDIAFTTTAFADYPTALGHDILDVLHQKSVSLQTVQSLCVAGTRDVVVYAGSYTNFQPITVNTTYMGQYLLQCKSECAVFRPTVFPATGNQSRLESGEDVVESVYEKATYVLSLTAERAMVGETTLLTLQAQIGSSNTNILVKVAADSEIGDPDLKIEGGSGTYRTKLGLNTLNQIAILSNNATGFEGIAILLNGAMISSVADAYLTGLTLTSPSGVFMYQVKEWFIYNTLLSIQDLLTLNNQEVSIEPGMSCICPQDYPIFKRWPHHNNTLWRGTHCESIDGENTTPRIQAKSFGLQFVNDGIDTTYWVSEANQLLNKLTFDLGARYQIFFATISLVTLPKYIVVTKQRSDEHDEEVLYVISDDCATPLPSNLPQATPLVCKDQISLFKGNGADHRGRVALLNWADEILYPDLVNTNLTAFNHSLAAGVFEARYISVYFYEHVGARTSKNYHIISEMEVYGSCFCAKDGECIVSDSRKYRPIGVTVPPMNIRMSSPYSFQQFAGYRCSCPVGYGEPYCETCTDTDYLLPGGICQPCNCGIGSVGGSCDSTGRCTCTGDARAGTRPDLADEKCRPFIHTLTPPFGPIAGGTEVVVEGAWLADVEFVYFGTDKVYKLDGRSNDTHLYVTTNKSEEGSVDVYIASYQSLSFDFKPNPNITIIGRIDVFASGGVDIPVTGTSLDSIADPKILVNVICKSSQQRVKAVEGDCTVNSPEDMVCQSPDLRGALDGVSCAPLEARRKRRKRQLDRYDVLYDFLIGFKLDGFEKFEDASETPWLETSAQLTIQPDPVIFEFDEDRKIRIMEETETQLEITGRNLQSGATKEDYNVTVGMENCPISFLYDRSFKCRLGSGLPTAGEDYKVNPNNTEQKLPSVVVKVGNIQTHVGYVARPTLLDTSNTVGIAVGVSVAAVVVIAVVVTGFICIRRKTYGVKKAQEEQRNRSLRYVAGPMGKTNKDFLDEELMQALENWLVPREKLDLGNALGQGQFGKVFLGQLVDANGAKEKVAVKTIKADLLRSDGKAVSNFLQEAILMKDFNHPNVLSLTAVIINEEHLPMVVTPFMSKGDLKRVLRNDDEDFTVGDLIHFGLQAANGMDYLAKKKFIHRDLAARNCMVDSEYFLKIADFGMSHDIYSEDYYRVQDRTKPLPVKWMAIESLETGRYTVESDVWSYGILLWEIMTRGATPYPDVNNYDIKSHLKFGRRLAAPEYCPVELYDLMAACWSYNATERPLFHEISETLCTFLNEHSDYHRENTKDIEEAYYTEPVESDYMNEKGKGLPSPDYDGVPAPDYDVAMPVEQAPSNPKAFSIEFSNANKNNSNNQESIGPKDEESYLVPSPSIKEKAKPETEPFVKKSAPQKKAIDVSYKKRDEGISFVDARKKLRSVGKRLSREGMPEAVKNPYVY